MSNIKSVQMGNKIFFNNAVNETGTLSWLIENDRPWCKKQNDYSIDLKISDCNNIIHFDFNVYKNVTKKDRVKKVDAMINELNNFKTALLSI